MADEGLLARDVAVDLDGRPIVRVAELAALRGTVTALLGPNGAGKSTLLRAILGLVPATGTFTVDGTPLASLDSRQRARRVAYVPQQSPLDVPLPARRVVLMGRFPHAGALARPAASDWRAVDEALAATDATDLAARPFTHLSWGERRRILVARALATEAPVLLLDEPTASLDVGHALSLLSTLRRLAATGRAIVVALHPLDEALAWTDRAVLLERGSVASSGPTAQVVEPTQILRSYGVDMLPGGGPGFRLPGGTT